MEYGRYGDCHVRETSAELGSSALQTRRVRFDGALVQVRPPSRISILLLE